MYNNKYVYHKNKWKLKIEPKKKPTPHKQTMKTFLIRNSQNINFMHHILEKMLKYSISHT